jgi:hypothetical protein
MREEERWVDDQDDDELDDELDIAGVSSLPMHDAAPQWTRRLTARDKLRHGCITIGAVAVAVVTLLAPVVSSSGALVASRLAQVLAAPPTPTERPVPTYTARAALVAQPAETAWTAIALPSSAVSGQVVASALDPRVAFACIWPSADAGANAQVWRTNNAGATWSTLALPAHSGESCSISQAADAPNRMAALFSHSDSAQPACAASWLYLSDDGGRSWSRAPHTPVGPSSVDSMRCEAWRAGAHLYFQVWYAYRADLLALERAILERSDDGGRSWTRIDGVFSASGTGIFAGDATFRAWPFSDGETLLASVVTPDGSAIWLSRDAGRDWTKSGMIANIYTTNLALDASAYQSAPAPDRPLYATSLEQLPATLFRLRAFSSVDGAQWKALPALPVPGAAPTRTGLVQVGGVARSGLLALGVSPQTRIPDASDQDAAMKAATTSLWIWRWDPRGATWTPVVPAPAECLQCRLVGVTPNASADGATSGTYLWLTDHAPGAHAIYRAFLATPGRATRGK